MNQFLLKIDVRSSLNENKFIHSETIEGQSMIEVLSKLLIQVALINQKLKEEYERHHLIDDDIPF